MTSTEVSMTTETVLLTRFWLFSCPSSTVCSVRILGWVPVGDTGVFPDIIQDFGKKGGFLAGSDK